jgi:hypothetical protein
MAHSGPGEAVSQPARRIHLWLAAASNSPVDERPRWRANPRAHVGAAANASVPGRDPRSAPPDGLHHDSSTNTGAGFDRAACSLFDQCRAARRSRIIETGLRIPGSADQQSGDRQS